MTAVDGMKQLAKPWYSDQILPFDITLAGASELGAATAMKIFGVEILNEGSGVSDRGGRSQSTLAESLHRGPVLEGNGLGCE